MSSRRLKVNDRLNEWYDFGAATGGDLVELGKYLYQTESVSEVLAYIGRHSSDMPLPKVRFQALPPPSRGIGYEKSDCRPVTGITRITLTFSPGK